MEQHKSLMDRFADWAVAHFKENSLINSSIEAKIKRNNENGHYQFKIGDYIEPKEKNSQNKTMSNRIVLGCIEGNYFLQVSYPVTSKESEEGIKNLEVYPKSFIENNFEKINQPQ